MDSHTKYLKVTKILNPPYDITMDMNRIIKVYGHPRAGNNFLMALMHKNFYDGIDLSGPIKGFGHWTRENEKAIYFDADKNYVDVNKYGRLAGSHANLDCSFEDSIYIVRDCRSVWVSVWRNKVFGRKEDENLSFKEFMWKKLDWYWDFNNVAPIEMMPIMHWHNHVKSWSEKIFTVRYEDLILKPFEVLASIEEHYGLIRSHEEFELLDGLVGWCPGKGKIDAWKEYWDEDLLMVHDYIVPKDFFARFEGKDNCRESPKIAFVIPSNELMDYEDCCWGKTNTLNSPHMLLSCASEIDGYDKEFIDLRIDDIKKIDADIIVYPLVFNTEYKKMHNRMKEICDGKHIVISIPSGYAEDFAELDVFCVVYSEPETVIGKIGSFDDLGDWRNSVDGICYNDGEIVKKDFLKTDIHNLRPIDYSIVPKHYWERYNIAMIQVSRGCCYRCKFCIWGGSTVTDRTQKFRGYEKVVKDIWEMRKNAGRYIFPFLICSQLTSDMKWLRGFHSLMKDNPLIFHSNINLFDVTEEKLRLLAESGMSNASVGLEAVTDNLLAKLGKKHTFEDIVRGLKLLDGSGIEYHLHFRTGFGETEEDVVESIENFKRLKELDLKNILIHSFGPIIYYKGTEIFENPQCELGPSDENVGCNKIAYDVQRWYELVALLRKWGWFK